MQLWPSLWQTFFQWTLRWLKDHYQLSLVLGADSRSWGRPRKAPSSTTTTLTTRRKSEQACRLCGNYIPTNKLPFFSSHISTAERRHSLKTLLNVSRVRIEVYSYPYTFLAKTKIKVFPVKN